MSGGRQPVLRSAHSERARLLLVDDHREVLNSVSAMLSADFEVAGLATNGADAVDLARRIAPDLIVLDVNMPQMNGLQTMRALSQAGIDAPVVFLSMLDDDAVVGEALRRGGRGYVLKHLAGRDLGSAINQVLDGRVFVPSLTSLLGLADGSGPRHAMQRYADLPTFLDGVAALFDRSLRRGDATCVIATPDVREGVTDRLRARGWDVGGRPGHSRHLVIDADGALNRFMWNGMPDADVLAEIAEELNQYRLSAAGGTTGRLTIVGNMAASLMAQGNPRAAIALESTWSALTKDLPFFTVCVYSGSCFHNDVPELWSSACEQHAAVSHSGNEW